MFDDQVGNYNKLDFSLTNFKSQAIFRRFKFSSMNLSSAIFEGNASFIKLRVNSAGEFASLVDSYFEKAFFTDLDMKMFMMLGSTFNEITISGCEYEESQAKLAWSLSPPYRLRDHYSLDTDLINKLGKTENKENNIIKSLADEAKSSDFNLVLRYSCESRVK